jgi:hypothetical protein
MFDEPMSKSVVSFTKPTGQATPNWLLVEDLISKTTRKSPLAVTPPAENADPF